VSIVISVLKALSIIICIAITVASYLYRGKGLPPRGGELTKSDWKLIGVVMGALFLVLVYAFSR
jgi:hypothetical protein